MARIIIVKNCGTCPHISQPELGGQIWCDHPKFVNGKKKKDMVIPKWCPLDTIPDNKDGKGESFYHLAPNGRLMRVLK